jgi:lipopolysaccharide transport system ATP-binding protein
MYLYAEHLTVDFPLAQAGHTRAAAPGAQPLGGRLHSVGHKRIVRALDDVSFRLERGDRLALVGHNGSGKSTLLRVLAGIYHPDGGQVSSSSHVSGIFNISLGFRQEASGYRNLIIKGLMAGRSRAEIEAALPEIAEFTGLGPYLDMPVHTYSQGMAMRLAFAATTAFSNDILVMDEWIGAGDASFQERIVARMNDVMHASTIIVLASHSGTLLRRIANKAIWLEQGCVRMAGGLEVIDAYEAETTYAGLPAAFREQVRSGSGLWLSTIDEQVQHPHLLWNVRGRSDDLLLQVQAADGGPVRVARSMIQSSGAWPLPAWSQPGMIFEIVSRSGRGLVARCIVPG